MIQLPYIIAGVVIILVIVIIFTGYKKAPPDTAFIISGLRKKIIIGKASVKLPFLERMDKLSLKLIAIDVKTTNAVPTADYINIQVDAAVNVKISSEPSRLALAAQNFLNQNTQYIASIAREVLEGNMREIVGRMRLEEMVSDRQKFANLVKENAEPDLAAMGLDIVSFNVQNFSDGNGVIEDLGIDNISQIKKKAAIAKAEAEKEIAVAKAEADRQANDARINSEREIAKKNNELALQKAELKKMEDTKKAEADAAYSIQQQQQRKTIEITTAEASIAKQEKEVILKQREAEVQEKALDAQVKKKAEADRYARQQQSEAELYERQKRAEAEKFETEKSAMAMKATAEAQARRLQRSRRLPVSAWSVRRKRRLSVPGVLRKRRPWRKRRWLTRSTTMPPWRKCSLMYCLISPERLRSLSPRSTKLPLSAAETATAWAPWRIMYLPL